MAIAVKMITVVRTVVAIGKGVFMADITKVFYKRLEKWFSFFILFKTASSYFTKDSTAHNMFTLFALCYVGKIKTVFSGSVT